MSSSSVDDLVEAGSEYHAGFVTDVESETLPPGLDESVVRYISAQKNEPEWLTQWRLKAFAQWQEMREPNWAHVHYPPINFQDISYYSAPKSQTDGPRSLDEVDPELLRTYEKLGILSTNKLPWQASCRTPPRSARPLAQMSPWMWFSTACPLQQRSKKHWPKLA